MNKARQVTKHTLYGRESANINNWTINKHCAFSQISAANPPQRKAPKHCAASSEKKIFIVIILGEYMN